MGMACTQWASISSTWAAVIAPGLPARLQKASIAGTQLTHGTLPANIAEVALAIMEQSLCLVAERWRHLNYKLTSCICLPCRWLASPRKIITLSARASQGSSTPSCMNRYLTRSR